MPTHWLVERIQTAAAQQAAFMPVHAHFGVRALGATPGHAEFGQSMGPSLLDPHGRLCPGAFLVAGDAALGCAVSTMLGAGSTIMSLTLHAQFLSLDPGAATHFTVRAEATYIGAGSGFSTGEIADDRGRMIAQMSAQCGFLEGVPATTAPHPLDEPERWSADVDDATEESELAHVAVSRTDARLSRSRDGALTIAAMSTPHVRNSRGDMQGGVLGMLAEQAISACLVRNSPALAAAESMELDITYLRPVRKECPEIEIIARPEHAGRRFALARALGRDGAGRLVVSATGSRYAP
jgi:uncharacterized protein (TIGR00369 family)